MILSSIVRNINCRWAFDEERKAHNSICIAEAVVRTNSHWSLGHWQVTSEGQTDSLVAWIIVRDKRCCWQMLVLLHESGTEDQTNDTIYISRITVAKGRHGSIRVAETNVYYNCGLLIQS